MAWTIPFTAVPSAIITSVQWNASVRDNLLATSTAITTAANGYTVGTGANARAERFIVENVVDANETTTSTSYTSLATNGPLVSPVTGSKALVFVTGQSSNTTSGTTCYTSYEVSGSTTIAANDSVAAIIQTPSGQDIRMAAVSLASLTAGTNTFRMMYRCGSGGGTGSFVRRRITVMPL
jgi:hypothetical protein